MKISKLEKKKVIFIVLLTILVSFLTLVIPMDFFSHGYFCDVVEYDQISEEDRIGQIDLSKGEYETTFIPQKAHFRGFSINLINQPEGNEGFLYIDTYTIEGKKIETIEVNLSNVIETKYYMTLAKGKYRVGREYQVVFRAGDCTTVPSLQLVDNTYLSEEGNGNQLLMGYAYAESTFNGIEKIFIIVSAFCLIMFMSGKLLMDSKKFKILSRIALFGLLLIVFSWNYMYNSFDEKNKDAFNSFLPVSEPLVTGVIVAEQNNIEVGPYGMGFYTGLQGSDGGNFVNNEQWDEGYSYTEPQIVIANNAYTAEVAMNGNTVQFANGDKFVITEVVDSSEYKICVLNSKKPLNRKQYGDLSEIKFIKDGEYLPAGKVLTYVSSCGLQGTIFRYLARGLGEGYLEYLHLFCSMALAGICITIILLLRKKYDLLMSVCFGMTFLLSPWVVNAARDLYWVEFTWFLPMAIGLICSIWVEARYVRIGCYIATVIAIAIKSLCGYEYITTIMLGLIVFLCVDLICAFINKDFEKMKLLFRTIFLLGIFALLGFFVAICIHAFMRGNGNIIEGIKSIVLFDVLRRVGGGSLNNFDPVYWSSLNASIWEVFKMYFHTNTEIILGIDGNMFPLVSIMPLIIMCVDYKNNKLNKRDAIMYVLFFITSTSWFIMGKSHSYIHTFLNHVLWYFGFVQICFYIIIKKVVDTVCIPKGKKEILQ